MHPKKKVLVVDDNEINAKMLEEFLGGQGYGVTLAYTAQEGIQAVAEHNPDIIILDLFLPDMKGSQVCVQLRARRATQHIPIILCTAHSISQNEKIKGFQSGVDDYLIRPFELGELAVRMEALLRRATPHFNSQVLAGIDALLKIPHQPRPVTPPAPPPAIAAPVVATLERPAKSAVTAPESISTPVVPLQPQPFHPLQRILAVLNHPQQAFVEAKQHEDLLVSLVLILGTPMIASLTEVDQLGTGSWLASLGVRIGAHVGAWFAIGGVLHVSVPFLGKRWSMKKSLSIAGLTWAPKALEAILAVMYAYVAPLFVARALPFSGGLDLFPGVGAASGSLLSEISVFSIWSVGILLVAVWTLCATKKRWTSITVTIGLIALACGMIAHV